MLYNQIIPVQPQPIALISAIPHVATADIIVATCKEVKALLVCNQISVSEQRERERERELKSLKMICRRKNYCKHKFDKRYHALSLI